jgi:hypothetical protein
MLHVYHLTDFISKCEANFFLSHGKHVLASLPSRQYFGPSDRRGAYNCHKVNSGGCTLSNHQHLDRSIQTAQRAASPQSAMHTSDRDWWKNTKQHEAALSQLQEGCVLISSHAQHRVHGSNLICNRVGANGMCHRGSCFGGLGGSWMLPRV